MKPIVVVGGGISGLSTAWYLRQRMPDQPLIVLESGAEPGGTARSERLDGDYTFELGPNGFLTNVESTLTLARDVGLGDELIEAADAARRRYLYKDGRLVALPLSPPAFITTELLSWHAKLRVALEPLVPTRHPAEETVFGFAARRLGREFAEAFIEPMVIGITGGDARTTSLDALFPRMRALESEHGGLFAGMLAKRKERGMNPGPSGRLTTLRTGGMGRLTRHLAESLGEAFRPETPVERIVPSHEPGVAAVVETSRGSHAAAAVICAVPAWVACDLLDHWRDLGDKLRAIPYSDIAVYGLAYDLRQIRIDLDGFGFLVPRGQGVRMLGCLWTSSIFPDQAPTGKALLRVMAGGAHDPGFFDLPEREALDTIRHELDLTMGVRGEPELVRCVRWRNGIPQYQPHHPALMRDLDNLVSTVPGLFLAGNAYRGISLNDCVANAHQCAHDVGRFIQRKKT